MARTVIQGTGTRRRRRTSVYIRDRQDSSLRNALVATLAFAAVAGAQQQAGQAAPAGPSAGEAAPDFTATATDSTGKIIPVSLKSLRGKVVVLAFYPLDRSSGCTAELTKFRDEYKTLFGEGVVVFPTSVDTLGSHASWAKDAHFPFAMIADPKSDLAKMYASDGVPAHKRTICVIGKDGRYLRRSEVRRAVVMRTRN